MPDVLVDAPTADALVRLAAERDVESWRLLVERHGAAMYSAALRVTRDEHLAADACQEAFLRVRDGARRFVPDRDDAEAAARGWLVRVATTTALMQLRGARRRRHRERPGPLADVPADDGSRCPPGLTEVLDHAIAGLPATQREPLVLHFYGGLDYDTIAATLGTTAGSARVRVHRGLERLRARLGRRDARPALAAVAAAPAAARTPPPAVMAGWIALLHAPLKAAAAAGGFPGGAALAGYGVAALLTVALAAASLVRTAAMPLVVRASATAIPPAPDAASARVTLADMPANTWVRMHPTSSAPGAYTPIGTNNTGAYDPGSQRVVIFDHWSDATRPITSYANAMLAYDPAADVVSVLKFGNWNSVGVPCADGSDGCGVTAPILPANTVDPTPVDRQPFGCVAAIPELHAVLIVNGLNQSAVHATAVIEPGKPVDPALMAYHPQDAWAFDLRVARWTKVSDLAAPAPHPPNDPGSPAVMAYDSANRVVALFRQKNTAYAGTETWLFDPVRRTWRQVPQDPTSLTVDTSASGIAYDARRGRILVLGGGYQFDGASPTLSAYSVTGNRWSRLADCPRPANFPGFAYDSTHDVFLAVIGDETWIYEPAADAWARSSAVIERPARASAQSITYDPVHDVFVFAGGTWDDPNWSLYRFSR